MKLYTEEQVKDAFYKGFYTDYRAIPYSDTLGLRQTPDSYCREFFKNLKPIEIPSDDEICDEAESIAHNYFVMQKGHYQGLEEGAKRMAYWLMKKFKQEDK